MTTTHDDLHARIDHLADEQLDHAAALLDALAAAAEPLPPGSAAPADDAVKSVFAHRAAQQARAQQVANNTESPPLPLALEALGDYVGARPGLTSDLLAHKSYAETDPLGAALVDDQQRQLAGYNQARLACAHARAESRRGGRRHQALALIDTGPLVALIDP